MPPTSCLSSLSRPFATTLSLATLPSTHWPCSVWPTLPVKTWLSSSGKTYHLSSLPRKMLHTVFKRYPTGSVFQNIYPTGGRFLKRYPTGSVFQKIYPTGGRFLKRYPTGSVFQKIYPTGGRFLKRYPTGGRFFKKGL